MCAGKIRQFQMARSRGKDSAMSNPSLLFLPGAGICPKVMTEVHKVIDWFERCRGLRFDICEDHVDGAAIDAYGTYL